MRYITSRMVVLSGMVCSAVLVLLCVKSGHNWGGDFALYISQAQALLNGSVSELYQANKFQADHSLWNVGPYLYPFGFPALIAPVVAIAGVNFVVLKIYCMCFFIATLPLVFLLFRDQLPSKLFTWILFLFVAINVQYVAYADHVLSDIPFTFFIFLTLYIATKPATLKTSMLLGLCLFYAYFTRDSGLALIPALITLQVFKRRQGGQRKAILLFLPYIIFILLVSMAFFLLPRGNANFYVMLRETFSFMMLGQGLHHYYDLIPATLFGIEESLILKVLVLLLIIAGSVITFKRTPHFTVFVYAYFGTIIIWPGYGGTRYLFPVLPFFIYFMLHAIISISNRFTLKEYYFKLALVTALGAFMGREIYRTIEFSKADTNECDTAEWRGMYDFIRKNVPEKEVIGFFKPHVLRLFTGRNSICADSDRFYQVEANYLLIEKTEFEKMKKTPEVVFETRDYILLKKRNYF